jgi:large subunit ribosomal protein L5
VNKITLQDEYKTKIVPALQKELGIKNPFAVPRVAKVKVSVGFGKTARKSAGGSMDEAMIAKISDHIAQITGQKPRSHKARIAISNFKLRAGMVIGLSTTLRGVKMYDFLSRLVNVALPRVRDFRGIPAKSFDGHGNYSVGMKDFGVFPEILPEDVEITHGLEITVVTTTNDDAAAYKLLAALGFPFQKNPGKSK